MYGVVLRVRGARLARWRLPLPVAGEQVVEVGHPEHAQQALPLSSWEMEHRQRARDENGRWSGPYLIAEVAVNMAIGTSYKVAEGGGHC